MPDRKEFDGCVSLSFRKHKYFIEIKKNLNLFRELMHLLSKANSRSLSVSFGCPLDLMAHRTSARLSSISSQFFSQIHQFVFVVKL
jgi:hypothetical protein